MADVSPHSIAQVDMINATSKLQIEAADVRNSTTNRPNWVSYLRSQIVPQEEYNFINAYESAKSKAERDEILARDPNASAKAVICLITDVAKDQIIRYVLTLFDDLLQEDKKRVDIFHNYAKKEKRTIWSWFQGTLTRQDPFIVNMTSSIFAKLATYSDTLMEEKELNHYFSFLKDQLKASNNEYINTTARSLQMLLRVDEYRQEFVKNDGITALLSALNGRANFQLQYQLIFCLWSLSFNPEIAEKIQASGAIQVLGDILSECSKEKVIRIVFATFRNILEKITDREVQRLSALQMVQCKTLKTLELMDAKKFDDVDLQEDIEFLNEKLHTSVQDLSSFDEYCTEVRSGRLQWSPVHKSEKFWRENAQRFNEKNFELIKILVQILDTTGDPLILCVAAHDIGEYVRHYPRGKNVLEQLQGKQAVMRLLSADDPNVRYHALLAVQKLMVHNWEYLGKQLEHENNEPVAAK
uniref:V-type proton ATPase subunit H n=1 Tax=Panagrellus redivivus TaxID=6233 RepID=A0A7E4VL29_PANRE